MDTGILKSKLQQKILKNINDTFLLEFLINYQGVQKNPEDELNLPPVEYSGRLGEPKEIPKPNNTPAPVLVPVTKVQGQVPQQVPQRVPQRVPRHVPKQVPEQVPQQVPQQVPEQIPQQVPTPLIFLPFFHNFTTSQNIAPEAATQTLRQAATNIAPKAASEAATQTLRQAATNIAPKAASEAATQTLRLAGTNIAPKAASEAATQTLRLAGTNIASDAASEAGTQALRLAGTNIAPEVREQLVRRLIAREGAERGAKFALKKLPIGLGLLAGAGFAASAAAQGDWEQAGYDLASGAASTVPGPGTAASIGIDAWALKRQLDKELDKLNNMTQQELQALSDKLDAEEASKKETEKLVLKQIGRVGHPRD